MGKKLTNKEVQDRIDISFKQKVELISDYINKRTSIRLRCLECGYEWETYAQTVLYTTPKNKYHYCPNCYVKKEKFSCAYCGKEFYRVPSEIKNNVSGYFYCSRECGNKHKNQLRKESGEWDNSLNYRKKAFDIYEHKCCVCGWDEDFRILEVHHIDENRENNIIQNLCILCPTCHRKITLGYYTLVDNVLIEK